ncbi:hypothetical protein Ahy_A01g004374 [Arachis hypogaea]|uniref:FAR1 domain-containing protein n=1 Tax=Arachis hypogaea TaxID=3818 RepID=A0A445EVX8_ARAHY|nr:hypothetical protein Ahy_A01g004374 [Arachis hypogaea]
MYVILDRQKDDWMVLNLELKHTHPCSAKKSVHYHEYRELTMHVKCVIKDNDEPGIQPNKTYLALTNKVGGLSNLSYSEKDCISHILNKIPAKLGGYARYREIHAKMTGIVWNAQSVDSFEKD